MLSASLTHSEGGCFLGESSLKSKSGGRGNFLQDSNYNNKIVEGDKHMVSKSFCL